jgi:hypothetical protein
MSLSQQDIDDFKDGNAALKAARADKLEGYHMAKDDVEEAAVSLATAQANKETVDIFAGEALDAYKAADQEYDNFNRAFIAKLEADINDNPTGS